MIDSSFKWWGVTTIGSRRISIFQNTYILQVVMGCICYGLVQCNHLL